MLINAPQNLQELDIRCQQISGQTIGALARELNIAVPKNLLQAKGWMGQLLEQYLGATGASQAIHDFPALSIELKTIPVNAQIKPLESTYVCTLQSNEHVLNWRDSWVYRKLQQVLWVPILGDKSSPIEQRVVMTPVLWHMPTEIEEVLQTDWQELMELMQLGHGTQISAKYGTYLHIRPKAANSRVLTSYLDNHGFTTKIVPKGFYLRPSFTKLVLG